MTTITADDILNEIDPDRFYCFWIDLYISKSKYPNTPCQRPKKFRVNCKSCEIHKGLTTEQRNELLRKRKFTRFNKS